MADSNKDKTKQLYSAALKGGIQTALLQQASESYHSNFSFFHRPKNLKLNWRQSKLASNPPDQKSV